MIHLSTRLAWHDTGWNGCICREPHLNASCIVQEQIRDGRDDDLERAHAGVPLADLPDWFPHALDFTLSVPAYREGWERKRRWYEEQMCIPVVGDGVLSGTDVEPGISPLVITSRDGDDGSIDQQRIEALARRYILLK